MSVAALSHPHFHYIVGLHKSCVCHLDHYFPNTELVFLLNHLKVLCNSFSFLCGYGILYNGVQIEHLFHYLED